MYSALEVTAIAVLQTVKGTGSYAAADLAVHTICHASMTRYAVPKVFDFEAPLETTCKKPAKRSND